MNKLVFLLILSMIAADAFGSDKQIGVAIAYTACTQKCKMITVSGYYKEQIEQMKDVQFCEIGSIMQTGAPYSVDKATGQRTSTFYGYKTAYALVEDCKKMSNLPPSSDWWFSNPKLKD